MKTFLNFLIEKTKGNRGNSHEDHINRILKSQGLTPKNAPLSINKSPNDPDGYFNHNGGRHNLEIKGSAIEDMGQISVAHHADKGWHIPDHIRRKSPMLAAHIEKSGILERMNGDPEWQKRAANKDHQPKDIYHDVIGTDPIKHYYSHDKNVQYMEIGGHGLYHTDKDTANLGTNELEGNVMLRARVKNPKTVVDENGNKKKVGGRTMISVNLHRPGTHTPRSHLSIEAGSNLPKINSN